MLKRLIDRLTNKKTENQPTTATSANELITVYDTYGRELKITRAEWLDKILLPSIKAAWDKPDELYGRILGAVNDGFFPHVADASARLVSIDPIVERSHVIRAIVLMKTGDLDEAELVLRKAIERIGETGTLLTNLAKIYTERKDIARSDELLWRAIQLDPNQENGLGWWAVIQRERHGEAGYIDALKKAADIAGSWRPQLWLARNYLEAGEVTSATAIYKDVLAKGLLQDDALMMISGDLGTNRQITLIPALIAPIYDPIRHDPRTGLNLLQAYLELHDIQNGEILLHKLYALQLAPYKQHLDYYAAEFHKLQGTGNAPQPIESTQELQFENVQLDRPIWMYGLSDPTWQFSQKSEQARKVTFISFSKIHAKEANAQVQREDEIGRMTRAIPMYLAEAVHFWTDLKGITFIHIVKGGGPVVSGSESDDAMLCDQLKGKSDYLVTGSIAESGLGWKISIRLSDCADNSCIAQESIETAQEELGAAILHLQRTLLDRLGYKRASPFDPYYDRPTKEALKPYLVELGQHLTLTLIANELTSKDGLWGERNMLEWPLRMALEWPDAQVPKIMYLSGLAKAANYKSEILDEFKDRTLEMIKEAKRSNSVIARFEPLLFKIFDMEKQLVEYSNTTASGETADYRKWLAHLNNHD
jgi:tetratricopeptide (TPR) repeat protein